MADTVGMSFPLDEDLHRRLRMASAMANVPIRVYLSVLLDHVLPTFEPATARFEVHDVARAIDRWIWNDGEGVTENDEVLVVSKLSRNQGSNPDTERA
jgi:hypothetical protein